MHGVNEGLFSQCVYLRMSQSYLGMSICDIMIIEYQMKTKEKTGDLGTRLKWDVIRLFFGFGPHPLCPPHQLCSELKERCLAILDDATGTL